MKANKYKVYDSEGCFVKQFENKIHALNYKATFGNNKWTIK